MPAHLQNTITNSWGSPHINVPDFFSHGFQIYSCMGVGGMNTVWFSETDFITNVFSGVK